MFHRCFESSSPWAAGLAALLFVQLAGCDGGSGASTVAAEAKVSGEGRETVSKAAAIDTSVPPELGGPGFTGEGWLTAVAKPIGDPRAVPGGALTSYMREWPGSLRMLGTGYNTRLNYRIRDLAYMSLLNLNPNTLEEMPALATHWKFSEDKMTFSYRINPKARWSDGKPVVAEDVVASWKIRMDPTALDPSAQLVYGKLNEPVAKSKYIVEVTAKTKNWRNFLYFSGMTILPAHEIGNITGKEYLDKYNYAYTAVTGPYIVHARDIVKGKSITVTRRDDWWAEGEPWTKGLYNFKKIRFLVVSDPQLAFQKTLKGELDFMEIAKAEWWAKDLPIVPAVEKGWLVRQKIFNDAPNGVSGFVINTRQAPLNDLRVRKALQYLYDRDTLIDKLAYGEYTPLDSYWPGGEYENPGNEKIRYSLERAVELLAAAGWKDHGPDGTLRKDGKPLVLTLTWYSPLTEKFLTSFKQSCAKVGVEIKLDRTNPETLWKNLMERKFQLATIGWGALVFPNPETSYHSRLASQDNNNNLTGFSDPRVDELCDAYDVAFDQDERRRIVREIDAIVYAQQPYVLQWYLPCQRLLYWNKFGMPEKGLSRTEDYDGLFATWWVDPEKVKALKSARRNGMSLPIPPLEIHGWDTPSSASDKPAPTP